MYEELIIEVDGVRTAVYIDELTNKNDNRTVCFVFGLSSHYHDKFSDTFINAHKIVLLDLYWTSTKFSDEYISKLSIDNILNHVACIQQYLIENFGLPYKEVLVLAHSGYGLLGVAFANKYPNQVKGIVAMGTPIHFNLEKLEKTQELYLESNFWSEGSKKELDDSLSQGSSSSSQKRDSVMNVVDSFFKREPTERSISYYRFKSDFSTRKPNGSKEYFTDWYVGIGPLLWKKEHLWRNQNDIALKLWDPWVIVYKDQQGDIKKVTHDINMSMMSKFFEVLQKTNWEQELREVSVPTLWFIGLYDSRVSMYTLEDYKKEHEISEKIEFFYISSGHWPMLKEDGSTKKFDKKVLEWESELSNRDDHEHRNSGMRMG